jgi:2-polyprenyl-3-methyl-5-hydroxy-6-metoxy-1,4-benzoquinol methylase
MNVQTIINQIHSRVEAENGTDGDSVAPLLDSSFAAEDLRRLSLTCRRADEAAQRIGMLPPSPRTLRGRVGRVLVRIVQKMLFWYTPAVADSQREAAAALQLCFHMIQQQQKTISGLQKDLRILRYYRSSGAEASRPGAEPLLPPTFEFALQNDFRGTEKETSEKLAIWLDEIREAGDPSVLARDWLDIGCGRGEWLKLATRDGRAITGIDPSPMTVEHCRAINLPAEHADAITYLQEADDGRFGVITAFHVVEHLPGPVLVELARLVTRKLAPGGVFAIETPNSANLQMGANLFWNDLTHLRPIPIQLMRFIFEYFSLEVVKILELNPFSRDEQLAWSNIEPVETVNRLLCGPRDYGVIGRRGI